MYMNEFYTPNNVKAMAMTLALFIPWRIGPRLIAVMDNTTPNEMMFRPPSSSELGEYGHKENGMNGILGLHRVVS